MFAHRENMSPFVYFSSGDIDDFDLWRFNVEQNILEPITGGDGVMHTSPDVTGKSIAYVSNENSENLRLWTIDHNLDKKIAITPENMNCFHPRWDKSGKKIVFSASKDGKKSRIFMYLDKAVKEVPIKAKATSRYMYPSFDKKAQNLVFVEKAKSKNYIWSKNLKSGKLKCLYESKESLHYPILLSNEDFIVSTENGMMRDIYYINGETHDKKLLGQNDPPEFSLRITPGEEMIYWVDDTSGKIAFCDLETNDTIYWPEGSFNVLNDAHSPIELMMDNLHPRFRSVFNGTVLFPQLIWVKR